MITRKKRVYIANTGGTIGMQKTEEGYAPASGFLQEQMAAMPEFKHRSMPEYDIHEYDPLLDSSNMTPDDWLKIAHDIADHYEQYDGFLVLHGTDTMAYTASALPFMLQGLQKPVIITGSQIPLCEIRNDARENLITAMMMAAGYPIPEVCLYFGTKLLRGCRSVKVDADDFEAFASPNFPPLGTVGINIEINWDLVLRPPEIETLLEVKALSQARVGALRLFPGISAEIVRNVLQPPLQGLVMEAYGVGNGPSQDRQFLAALEEGTSRGVIIVDCTQCLAGTVDLGDYVTGSALARAGVISGFDMTAEAALAKMFYLFSQNLPTDTIKQQLQTNLRGELTRPERGSSHAKFNNTG
jgi:L-asparaginase